MSRYRLNHLVFPAIVILLLQGCAYINLDLASIMQFQPFEERVITEGGDEKILVLEILGPITTTAMRDTILPRQGTLERIDAILEKVKKDKDIKGLILRIDSPGGGYTASDLTFRRIMEYKKDHSLPVVACITNQGTSGAYMIALSADQIVALPSSVVGNVGVLLPSISLEGLMDKLGIRNQTLTSGRFKDAGNPLRDMTDADMEILEDIVMEFHRNFIERVKMHRPVTDEDLTTIEDGRVMTATTGLRLHLVDQVGYYEDAVTAMESLAAVEDPTVVVYRRRGENKGGFYSWP
ncbi:MAG: signal peptide peptidase SppA [Desulfomonilia bacterium]